MRTRFLVALIFPTFCCAQTYPAFNWATEVSNTGTDQIVGIGTDPLGDTYIAGTTQSPNFPVKAAVQDHLAGGSNAFVTKLDPSGNIVWSTYFGGSGADVASAMTVGPDGSVYVTGSALSGDFPTTAGAYSPTVPTLAMLSGSPTFLFKLNPDGSVGYSTYFLNSDISLGAIAADSTGAVWLTGISYGGVPTTSGAYKSTCVCVPPGPGISFFSIFDSYLTKFDPTGGHLVFSTYLGSPLVPVALAIAPDGSAYIGGTSTNRQNTLLLMNATGTSLTASASPGVSPETMALAHDGSLYLAGLSTNSFVPTAGAFQAAPNLAGAATIYLQTAIVRVDAGIHGVLAGTYFGGALTTYAKAMVLDNAGNVYVGGYTSPRSLPTRTPFFQGFGQGATGYVAELSPDLSSLIFSSQFGDNERFAVSGLATGANGSVVLGGSTGPPLQNAWVNSLSLVGPAAMRIDGVVNPDTNLSDPAQTGGLILIEGAGFGNDAQLLIGGIAATQIDTAPTRILAIVPSGLSGPAATVQVLTGGAASNSVLIVLAN